MLPLHVFIAIVSIALFATRLFADNKVIKISANISAVATLASGIGLIVVNPTILSHACISGTIYLVAVMGLARIVRLKRSHASQI